MSAFYDIWIGDNSANKPSYTRLGNNAWVKAHAINQNSWLSLPSDKRDFIQTAENGKYKMILLGQLYEEMGSNKLVQVFSDYIEGITAKLDEPAGHYIVFLYNSVTLQHHIFTNRLGTYHAYYSTIDGANTLSTYYIGLAKQATTKKLDWEGISGFMQMGFFHGNTTYLQGISILAPASHYTFDAALNMIQHKRYWNWTYEPKERNIDEWHRELDDILQDSLSCALKNKRISLPISGGLDSRLLAGKLTDNNPHTYSSIWSYSYGFSNKSVETKIAEEIASRRNISFNAYTVPNYLFNKSEIITDAVELFQYINGTRQASITEILSVKADVVIGGHWGDVWMDDMKVKDNDTAAYFQQKIIKKGSQWLLDEVCKPNHAQAGNVLTCYFNDWMHKYNHIPDTDFRMKIFKTDQWSFRWTVPSLRMYQAGAMPVLPFYDKRIVDLFTNIPSNILKNREFQIEFIKRYYPDLAKIKWQEYNSNLYQYKTWNNRNIAYRAYKKIQRSLSDSKPITRNWELFYLNKEGRKNLEHILLDNKAFCEIVPAEKSKQLLSNFYANPSAANGYAVSMMHTLAQFMKTVF